MPDPDPSTASDALSRARAFLWAGEGDRALEEYDRAVAAWPGDAALRAGRAGARFQEGEAAGALEDAVRALEIDSRCAEAWYVSARLRIPEGSAAAIADATRALEIDPDHGGALYWRAGWRAASGDAKGMTEDLERAAGTPRADPASLFYRAVAHLSLGDPAKAQRGLDGAIEAGFRLPFAYTARAEVRGRLGDGRGAAEDLGIAIGKLPGRPGLHVERGRARMSLGDRQGAEADFARAIELDPACAAALYYGAKLRGADDEIQRLAAVEPSDAEGFYFRGLARQALKRRREAARDFAKAMELAPAEHARRPEMAERYQATRRRSALEVLRASPITCLIAAANLAVWLAQGNVQGLPSAETLLAWGAIRRYLIWEGDYWRLVTAIFLHIGPIHVLWNTYWSFPLCGAVEKLFGSRRFLLAYLLTGIGASAVSVLGHDAVSAGASGALFGMLGIVIYLGGHRMGSWRAFLGQPRVRRGLAIVGFFFLLGLFLPFDNYAHGGGLVFGLLFGWLYLRVPEYSRRGRVIGWGAALLLVGLTVGTACTPRWSELRAAFDHALRQKPDAPGLYLGRAAVRQKTGDIEGALEDIRRALEVATPDWPEREEAVKFLKELERGP